MMELPDWSGYLRFRPAFAGVVDPRRYPIEWLDGRVLNGSAQLWLADDAALVTEILTHPTGARDIAVLIAAGDAATIIAELAPRAEAWGRYQGCIGAIVESRAGWRRALAGHGYHLYQTSLRKDL